MRIQTRILIAVAAALTLFGCGASKLQTNAGGLISGSTISSSTSGSIAKCSHDLDNLSDLSIRLKVYEDSSGTARGDLIRLKFDRIPTSFSATGDNAFELWSRTADSGGSWGAWHKVSFYIESTGAKVTRAPYLYSDLTWTQMQQLATYFGMTGADASTFFASVQIIAQLTDTTVSKVLTAKLYMTSSSPETTALIPTFPANPNNYAQNHPAVLQALHPLQALANSKYSEDQYLYEANQFCF